jgi:hypothetical protein
LKNDIWCAKLAYLTDIFKYLNSVNTSIQGRNENILTSTDKLSAVKKKICLWKNVIMQKNSVDMFDSLKNEKYDEIIPDITEHLTLLEAKLENYFPSLNVEFYDWIRNPFGIFDTSQAQFSLQEEEELVSLSTDRTLKMKFLEASVDEFWISIQKEYPALSRKALNVLIQFSTSYLCELGFSTLTNIKTKKRERLTNIEEEMRVALSEIRPDIVQICKNHQAQTSH